MIFMMEQTVSSANLLMVQNLEDQLIDQWVTGPSKGTRTVWRKWADRNLVKVNKGKCKVLHLGRSKPRRMGYTMGAGRLESSFAGRAFVGFGCHQIEHNQAVCTHLWPIGRQSPGLSWEEEFCREAREGSFPLALVGPHPTVLCPPLGSPVQQRHGHTGKSLAALPRAAAQLLAPRHTPAPTGTSTDTRAHIGLMCCSSCWH